MISDKMNISKKPNLRNPRLLLGLSGWMDGGNVSTGTVKCLVEKLEAYRFAEISPESFYIYSFPGMMEVTALFRPHTKIKNGLIKSFEVPKNEFFCAENEDLILFLGKEPNLHWAEFAECIFLLCKEFGIKMIYFIGSVSGLVPHTREPRLFCSASDTHIQGDNPKCIEAVARRLAGILGLQIQLDDIRAVSDEFEKRLSEAVREQPELAYNIRKLEEDYDNENF